MLLRAYLANLAVSALGFWAIWAWAPSIPQVVMTVEQGFQSYARDNVFLGPVLYRTVCVRGN